MATIENFEDLKVWKEARSLANDVNVRFVSNINFKDFAFQDQINRSSGSVMDNIAEGFGRGGNKEFIQFLFYSNASCQEVKSQLYRALDRGHLSQDNFDEMRQKSESISKMIFGLVSYLKSTGHRGVKFKVKEPASHYSTAAKTD